MLSILRVFSSRTIGKRAAFVFISFLSLIDPVDAKLCADVFRGPTPDQVIVRLRAAMQKGYLEYEGHLTFAELGFLMDRPPAFVSNVLKGQRLVNASEAEHLAQIFGKSKSELFEVDRSLGQTLWRAKVGPFKQALANKVEFPTGRHREYSQKYLADFLGVVPSTVTRVFQKRTLLTPEQARKLEMLFLLPKGFLLSQGPLRGGTTKDSFRIKQQTQSLRDQLINYQKVKSVEDLSEYWQLEVSSRLNLLMQGLKVKNPRGVLASEMGIPLNRLSAILRGMKTMSVDQAQRASEFLNGDVSWLLAKELINEHSHLLIELDPSQFRHNEDLMRAAVYFELLGPDFML